MRDLITVVCLQVKDSGSASTVTDTQSFFSVPLPTWPCWKPHPAQEGVLRCVFYFTLQLLPDICVLKVSRLAPSLILTHTEKALFLGMVLLHCFMYGVRGDVMRSNCIILFCFSIKSCCYFGLPQIARFIFPCLFFPSVFSP